MSATDKAIEMAILAARGAAEVKATSLQALDVSERMVLTDVFLILAGSTERQVRAIVDKVEETLGKAGYKRLRREGLEGEARWVLLDYGEVMVHVQQEEDLAHYALDKLWGDCPSIALPDDIKAAPAAEIPLANYFDFTDLGSE